MKVEELINVIDSAIFFLKLNKTTINETFLKNLEEILPMLEAFMPKISVDKIRVLVKMERQLVVAGLDTVIINGLQTLKNRPLVLRIIAGAL